MSSSTANIYARPQPPRQVQHGRRGRAAAAAAAAATAGNTDPSKCVEREQMRRILKQHAGNFDLFSLISCFMPDGGRVWHGKMRRHHAHRRGRRMHTKQKAERPPHLFFILAGRTPRDSAPYYFKERSYIYIYIYILKKNLVRMFFLPRDRVWCARQCVCCRHGKRKPGQTPT